MKMKRYIYALVALLMFVSPLYAQENTTGISFFKGTFEEALVKAKQENKPLFVDFYAVWCVPCKKMAKTVFTQEAVGKYFNEHFISLQLDAEKGENVQIAKNYKVVALPSGAIKATVG